MPKKFGIPFIDADYDRQQWFDRAKGMEWEPERGIRCTMCFDMRFEKAAEYAHEHGFPVFTSCLGISRWKDMDQINGCGHRAAENMMMWFIGITTGVKLADRNAWSKSVSVNVFINRNIVVVFILYETAINGVKKQGDKKIEIGKLYYTPD